MTHEPNEEFLTDAELDANFDFNLVGTGGWGCLHAACSSGCQDIVEFLLIKKRVDPNSFGKDYWTPLEIAIQSGFFNIVDLLIKDKRTLKNNVNSLDRGSALHLAAKSNYLPICQILLLEGINLGIQDANGLLAKELTTSA
mmetsp:Transcript_3585/g.3534  ORF Transcript_3585/g.3534 Transcript_3585/m.3534 type:complete len:141 (-) Transcript_3585:50-472(-)